MTTERDPVRRDALAGIEDARHATAQLLLRPSVTVVRPAAVLDAARRLFDRGAERVITPALSMTDRQPYLDAGFTVHERLHLLRLDLRTTGPLPPPSPRVRRIRRGARRAVLALDARAFDPFWRLDPIGLADALAATPWSRLAIVGRPLSGYIICGSADRRGYIQRLAVDPLAQGRGLGTALLVHALRGLRRRRVDDVLVNTQEKNQAALELYRHWGFVLDPPGLAVLALDRTSTP